MIRRILYDCTRERLVILIASFAILFHSFFVPTLCCACMEFKPRASLRDGLLEMPVANGPPENAVAA